MKKILAIMAMLVFAIAFTHAALSVTENKTEAQTPVNTVGTRDLPGTTCEISSAPVAVTQFEYHGADFSDFDFQVAVGEPDHYPQSCKNPHSEYFAGNGDTPRFNGETQKMFLERHEPRWCLRPPCFLNKHMR